MSKKYNNESKVKKNNNKPQTVAGEYRNAPLKRSKDSFEKAYKANKKAWVKLADK